MNDDHEYLIGLYAIVRFLGFQLGPDSGFSAVQNSEPGFVVSCLFAVRIRI